MKTNNKLTIKDIKEIIDNQIEKFISEYNKNNNNLTLLKLSTHHLLMTDNQTYLNEKVIRIEVRYAFNVYDARKLLIQTEDINLCINRLNKEFNKFINSDKEYIIVSFWLTYDILRWPISFEYEIEKDLIF